MGTELASQLPYPPHWINAYLFSKLQEYVPSEVGVVPGQVMVPFFKTMPGLGKEETYQSLIQNTGLQQPLMVEYDKMARYRGAPFYGIKKEQVLYTLHGSLPVVEYATMIISQLLDREDAAAEDVNKWASDHSLDYNFPHNVFFHRFKVFQIDETRDLLELSSVNLVSGIGKVIIEYDYHTNWDPSQEQFK